MVSGVAGRFVLRFTEMLQMGLALAARLKMSQALASRSSPERQQGGSRADAVDGRDLVLEGYGMCACKWAQVLSLLLEQAYPLLHSAPATATATAPAPDADAGDGPSSSSGVGLFMSHYLAYGRPGGRAQGHADSVAGGAGARPTLRPLRNHGRGRRNAVSGVRRAAQGAHRGSRRPCTARRALALLARRWRRLSAALHGIRPWWAPRCRRATRNCGQYTHPLLEMGRGAPPAPPSPPTAPCSSATYCRAGSTSRQHEDSQWTCHRTSTASAWSCAWQVAYARSQQRWRRLPARARNQTAVLLDSSAAHLLPLASTDHGQRSPPVRVARAERAGRGNGSESLFLSVLENDWAAAGAGGAAGGGDARRGAPAFPCNAQAVMQQ